MVVLTLYKGYMVQEQGVGIAWKVYKVINGQKVICFVCSSLEGARSRINRITEKVKK